MEISLTDIAAIVGAIAGVAAVIIAFLHWRRPKDNEKETPGNTINQSSSSGTNIVSGRDTLHVENMVINKSNDIQDAASDEPSISVDLSYGEGKQDDIIYAKVTNESEDITLRNVKITIGVYVLDEDDDVILQPIINHKAINLKPEGTLSVQVGYYDSNKIRMGIHSQKYQLPAILEMEVSATDFGPFTDLYRIQKDSEIIDLSEGFDVESWMREVYGDN